MSIFSWFRRAPDRSRFITQRTLDEYEIQAGDEEMLRVIIDTKQHIVIPVPKQSSHQETAAIHLGIPKADLNTRNAGHLVGGFAVRKEGRWVGMIGKSSLRDTAKILYDQHTLDRAHIILESYFRDSEFHWKIDVKAA